MVFVSTTGPIICGGCALLVVTSAGKILKVLAAIVALSVFSWQKTGNYARADGQARLGVSALNRGEAQEGLRLIQDAASTASDVPSFHLMLADALESLGAGTSNIDIRLRTGQGRYANAGRAIEANPIDPGPRTVQANAALNLHFLGQSGFIEIAVTRAQEVATMLPSFAISHYDAALMLLVAERTEEALASLDRADELLESAHRADIAAEGRYLRGLALRQAGDLDGAAAHFRASLELDPAGRFAGNATRALAEIESGP